MMVEGDSGMMGGAVSHEYMAYADAGEDEIVFCRECGYASNVETAVAGADPEPPASELSPTGAADAPFAKATGAPVDLLSRPNWTRRAARPSSRSRPISACRRARSSRRSW